MSASSSASSTFSPELRSRAEELIGRYPGARSALLPLLHLVQHADGYVSAAGVAECADLLGLTKAEVGAVATFYTMYKREPMGRHLVSVCTNFSCKVRGAQEVYDALSDKLGVGHNGTTSDGAITLEHAECLGNCEGAPVVSVDYLNYERQGAEQALALVDALISAAEAGGQGACAGAIPPPTRGHVPPGIRAVAHRLAGLGPVDLDGPGVAGSHARAQDGAVPAPPAGPGGAQVTIDVAAAGDPDDLADVAGEAGEAGAGQATDAVVEDREAARAAVREVGDDPDEVAEEAGDRSREFPSAKPDGEPDRTPDRTPGRVADDVRDGEHAADTTREDQIVEPEESKAEDRRQQAEEGERA
jgi:NADH-quinone oxidoreductase subunit E